MKGNDMNMPGNNETAYFTGSSPVVGTTLLQTIRRFARPL